MTDEEAYLAQAYGGLLEFAMATYEGLIHRKSSTASDLRRHKSMIREGFVEMGQLMLDACAHLWHKQGHPGWRRNIRVQALLNDLLLHRDPTPAVVIDKYLHEQEDYRAKHVR